MKNNFGQYTSVFNYKYLTTGYSKYYGSKKVCSVCGFHESTGTILHSDYICINCIKEKYKM